MTARVGTDYEMGANAARSALSQGVPRRLLVVGPDGPHGAHPAIDGQTGLPIAVTYAPAEMFAQQTAFADGFNGEIRRAIDAGEIHVDFRPLLLAEEQMHAAFVHGGLGALTPETPISDPASRFSLRVPLPRRRERHRTAAQQPQPAWRMARERARQTPWVVLERPREDRRELFLYEGPVAIALACGGRVLVFKTAAVYLSIDIVTAQTLNRYLFG